MTRKDYQLIAGAIKGQVDFLAGDQLAISIAKATATRIAYVLASENPRFDRRQFLSACGFEQS